MSSGFVQNTLDEWIKNIDDNNDITDDHKLSM